MTNKMNIQLQPTLLSLDKDSNEKKDKRETKHVLFQALAQPKYRNSLPRNNHIRSLFPHLISLYLHHCHQLHSAAELLPTFRYSGTLDRPEKHLSLSSWQTICMAHKKFVIRLRSIYKTSKQKQSMLCVILKYILMINAIFLNVCKLLRLLTNALDKLNRAIVPKHWSCIFFSIQPSIFYLQICIPPPHTHMASTWFLSKFCVSFIDLF